MSGNAPRKRIYFVFSLVFILTLGIVIHIVQEQTNSIINELTLNRVESANRSLVNYLTELKNRVIRRAEIIAVNERIAASIKSRDYESLKKNLLNLSLSIDFASICDSDGIILVRTHSDKKGDDVSSHVDVSSVLREGVISSSISVVPTTGALAICASAPVFDNSSLIGVVNCNFDLTKSDYVDIFKERTGCEASIFHHDVRISTTVTDDSGNRVVGSKASDFITKTVIGEQKDYLGDLDIYGKMYGACYSPLLAGGEVIGMLFTGVDIQHTIEGTRTMNWWIILASLVGIAAAAAFMVVANAMTGKYVRLSEKQLNQQILMADISRSFLSDTETGKLITNTLRMVGEFMDLSQLLLFMLEEDGITLTCRDEWMNPKLGLTSRIGGKLPLNEVMLSIIKNMVPGAGKGSCMHSDDPFIKKVMAPLRINFQNYITTPVFVKGEMVGAIDFSKGGESRKWDDSDISLATLFASTLSGIFEREAMGRRTSIIENSPHMIFYADSGGNMAYANPAVTTITGYSPDELKAGGFGLILDEQTAHDVREIFVPQALQKGTVHHESLLICKDGRRRILDVTSFIVNDGMVAAICMDITEIRALESELIKAKDKADEASHAKTEFLSNMSHEMRTPMNAIIGMTVIAKNATDNKRKDYALNKVEEASKYLLGIINDILDMTKIEANELSLEYAEFDLRDSLQKVISFVHFRIEEKRIRFSMNVDNNLPVFCIGDDQRLKQVIINLLSNAIKFTSEEGEINFCVSLAAEDNGICELRFEVTDNGIGISSEHQQLIFRMFEQVDSGTTRRYSGTGLGLAISERIIELMGGHISVESEIGKGSRFTFTAKLERVEKDTSPQSGPVPQSRLSQEETYSPGGEDEDSAEILEECEEVDFTGRKLLLAEDIEINREILISLLDGTGLIIDTAENGREALSKVTADPYLYDLIFMDMQMPEMDGLEATRSIRKLEAELKNPARRLPIIAMTANVFKDDIDNCLAAGMDDHIGKPIDINMVFEILRKYLPKS